MIDERIPNVDPKSWSYQDLIGQNKYNAWTPAITFATPGNVSTTYTDRIGSWTRKGNDVTAWCSILTSTFTHSSAAGNLRVTGLPFEVKAATNHFPIGVALLGGYTKANYTQVACYGTDGQTYLEFSARGSGQANATIAFGDVPSGGTVSVYATFVYEA